MPFIKIEDYVPISRALSKRREILTAGPHGSTPHSGSTQYYFASLTVAPRCASASQTAPEGNKTVTSKVR